MREEIRQLIEKYAAERLMAKPFVAGKTLVPVSGPLLSPGDAVALADTVLDFWYTEHKQCAKFSRQLAEQSSKKHVQLVNSGSSANLLAVLAMAEKWRGRFIITSATGFSTTLSPIYQANKIPIFVDIDPVTLSPDIGQIVDALEKYGKDVCGVIVAHTLGFPFNEAFLSYECRSAEVGLISDSCDALGAKVRGEPVGSWSDMVTYSFFPAHIVTAAEGGAVATNDDELHRVMCSLANWGRACRCQPGQSNVCGHRFTQKYGSLPDGWDHKYTFERLGYNLKMTEFQAALGASQMISLPLFLSARRWSFGFLKDNLKEYSDFLLLMPNVSATEPAPFGFPISVREGAPFTRQDLITYLEERKIATRPIFGGNLIRQPAFQNQNYVMIGELSGSDFVMSNAFWIGLCPAITKEMLDYVVEVFTLFFTERGL